MEKEYNQVELEIYLIRHGQTYGNLGKDVNFENEVDRHDVMLTPTGIHMAQLLGKRFEEYPFDCIYSSGMRRAMHTASEVVKRQPEDGFHKLVVHPLLSENGGDESVYTGLSFDEIRKLHPYAVLADGYSEKDRMISFTGGWNDAQQLKRADEVVKYIRSKHKNGEKIAIVAHAAFNTFLYCSILGLNPEKLIFDPHFLNTGVTKFIIFKEGTGRYADIQLVYQNDLSHLYNDYPDYSLIPCHY